MTSSLPRWVWKNKPPLYSIWRGILDRCNNPRITGYKNYGGRGVRVCERWSTYANFEVDMGPRPSPLHSVDRIDVNGNYEPGNCRWASSRVQARNKRTNALIEVDGQVKSRAEWSELSGINQSTIRSRLLRGISSAEAVSKPAQRHYVAPPLAGRPTGEGPIALTHRRTDILNFIVKHTATIGAPPSMRAIARAFGMRSSGGAVQHVAVLKTLGYLMPSGAPVARTEARASVAAVERAASALSDDDLADLCWRLTVMREQRADVASGRPSERTVAAPALGASGIRRKP